MLGRKKGAADLANGALEGVTPYVDQLAHDEKLRERLSAAIIASAAARKRARRRIGVVGVATTLASDPVLREQVAEAFSQLQKARARLKRNRSHKVRNTLVLLAGAGVAVAAVPSLRKAVMDKVEGRTGDDWSTYSSGDAGRPTSSGSTSTPSGEAVEGGAS
jgi:hypothetical protein